MDFVFVLDSERREHIPEIYQNIHESIYQLVQHMSILGLDYQSCASKNSAIYILAMGDNAPETMNEVNNIPSIL